MKRLLLALILAFGLLAGIAPSAQASGSAGTGTLLPLCSSWGGLTVDGIGSSSYADPFFGNGWLAEAHLTGYIGVTGAPFCPSTQLYGDATHTSYGARLIVLRYVYSVGWVSCGDYSDYTTGTNRASVRVAFGALPGYPVVCQYINWPDGLTYITGHVTALWNPSGPLWSPDTRGSSVNFSYYV